jgi:vancomycin resistance protein YoaR
MSAQVFRTTLIHPAIEVVKRRPHNERFVQYYGEDVGGDDAAVYEMSKQFEIKNSGTDDLYFKVKRGKEHTLLVAVSPRSEQRVEITKHPINERTIDLERVIWERSGIEADFSLQPVSILGEGEKKTEKQLVKQETFHSTYSRKNYELR